MNSPEELAVCAAENVLGVLLRTDNSVYWDQATAFLKDMPGPHLNKIYAAMIEAHSKTSTLPISEEEIITVDDSIKRSDLISLMELDTPRAQALFMKNVQTVKRYEIEIVVVEKLSAIIKKEVPLSRASTVDELLSTIQSCGKELELLQQGIVAPRSMKEHVADLVDELIHQPAPIPLPFAPDLNTFLNNGFHNGHTYSITAAAAQGKSDFVLWILDNIAADSIKRAADTNTPPDTISIYVSMEMGRAEHFIRSISRLAQIDSRYIRARVWDNQPADDGITAIDEKGRDAIAKKLVEQTIPEYEKTIAPVLFIEHGDSTWTINRLKAEINRIRNNYQHKYEMPDPPKTVVCVDPFNELSTGDRIIDRDENRMVGKLAGQLKQAARDLNVPIIIISDTTKEASKSAEEENAIASQADARASYEFVHRMNLSCTVKSGSEKLIESAETKGANLSWVKDQAFTHLRSDYSSSYFLLQPTKNREGRISSVWFIYQKAISNFIPLTYPRKIKVSTI